MKILDENGLAHYTQKLSKTNKIISLKCTSVNKYTVAKSIINPMINVIKQDAKNFCTVNNATLVLKDNDDNTRGVAQYIGNGASAQRLCVGYIDMYVFDSSDTYAQAKIMVNNGTIKQMS